MTIQHLSLHYDISICNFLMFRAKRSDTKICNLEETYRINLNTRTDTLLGNLLDARGFESLSQLLQAYRGKLTFHPKRRKFFLSFHYENIVQVRGFRLIARNDNIDMEIKL